MEIIELYFNPKEKKENLYQSFVLNFSKNSLLFGFLVIENCSLKSRGYFSKIEQKIKNSKGFRKKNFGEILLNLNQMLWRSPLSKDEKISFVVGLLNKPSNNSQYLLQMSWIGNIAIIINEERIVPSLSPSLSRFQRIQELNCQPGEIVWIIEERLFSQLNKKNIFSSFLANLDFRQSLSQETKKFFKNIDLQNLYGVGLIIKPGLLKQKTLKSLLLKNFLETWNKLYKKLNVITLPKSLAILLITFCFLLIALPLFSIERKIQGEIITKKIEIIKEESKLGKYFIRKNNKERAKALLLKAWEDKNHLKKFYNLSDFPEVTILEKSISQNLNFLFHLNKVKQPEVVLKINPKDIVPERIFCPLDNLVLVSNFQKKIFLPQENKFFLKNFRLQDSDDNAFFVYEKEKKTLTKLQFSKEGLKSLEKYNLRLENHNEFLSLNIHFPNIYFLDQSSVVWEGNLETLKFYPLLNLERIGIKQIPNEFEADSAFWFLNSNQKIIYKYQNGKVEKFDLNGIFPKIIKPQSLKTRASFKFIYFSDPLTKRVIALDKSSGSIKQWQLSEIPTIKDFCLSSNGKDIYILANNIVYKFRAE